MQPDTLIVVLGDSPRMPTGLGRIAGDIAANLWEVRERLGTHLLQVGWEYDTPTFFPIPWPLGVFPEVRQDWGYSQVVQTVEQYRQRLGLQPADVVLLSVWDPARCFEYRELPYQKWGYFAVDGHNRHGKFGGPAAEAVRKYDRVLAYGRYGAEILHNVLGTSVEYLPHGHYWGAAAFDEAQAAAEPPAHGWRLGCVASNTPRKDLGLFFAVLRELRDSGERVYGWLHTDDTVTGAWSIPELLEVYNIDPQWLVVSTPPCDERTLQAMYASCAVTLAVGRGEGFGYPIVESLAMGRAVVHCDYAGGAELTPVEGRIPVEGGVFDTTNPYVVQRPIVEVEDAAERCKRLAHLALADATRAQYYAGSVAHLEWSQLWPRWETWVKRGLNELRARR